MQWQLPAITRYQVIAVTQMSSNEPWVTRYPQKLPGNDGELPGNSPFGYPMGAKKGKVIW